jgi:SAM domain (Sterile alpha motif)
MQQVADWLEKLGLGQYAKSFAEKDISFSVLPDLTDQDLKDIGVSLGHRRQLLSFHSFLVIPFFGPPLRARHSPTPKGAIGRSTPAEKSQPASLYAGHIR